MHERFGLAALAAFAALAATSMCAAGEPAMKWRVVEIAGVDLNDAHPTLALQDGVVSGFTGCNQLSGSFQRDGDRVHISALATTRKACKGMMAVESAMLSALSEKTVVLHQSADSAELLAPDGQPLLRLAP